MSMLYLATMRDRTSAPSEFITYQAEDNKQAWAIAAQLAAKDGSILEEVYVHVPKP